MKPSDLESQTNKIVQFTLLDPNPSGFPLTNHPTLIPAMKVILVSANLTTHRSHMSASLLSPSLFFSIILSPSFFSVIDDLLYKYSDLEKETAVLWEAVAAAQVFVTTSSCPPSFLSLLPSFILLALYVYISLLYSPDTTPRQGGDMALWLGTRPTPLESEHGKLGALGGNKL